LSAKRGKRKEEEGGRNPAPRKEKVAGQEGKKGGTNSFTDNNKGE